MKKEKTNNAIIETGKTVCGREILTSIIVSATEETFGVARIASTFCFPFLKNCKKHGIKIKFNSNGTLVVDVFVDIFFGVNVPEVAFRIQENIKTSVGGMLDVKTARINVHVKNIVVKNDENQNYVYLNDENGEIGEK